MTPGVADCPPEAAREQSTDPEASASAEQVAPAVTDCMPGAAVGGSEIDVEMKEAHDAEVEEEVVPQQAMVMVVVSAPVWAQPIRDFLVDGIIPTDEVESRQIQRRSCAYTIINNQLIHRSTTGVLQCCVEEDKGLELLRDI